MDIRLKDTHGKAKTVQTIYRVKKNKLRVSIIARIKRQRLFSLNFIGQRYVNHSIKYFPLLSRNQTQNNLFLNSLQNMIVLNILLLVVVYSLKQNTDVVYRHPQDTDVVWVLTRP